MGNFEVRCQNCGELIYRQDIEPYQDEKYLCEKCFQQEIKQKQLVDIIKPVLVGWLGEMPLFPDIETIADLIADKILLTDYANTLDKDAEVC